MITPQHYSEWQASCVDEGIIQLNVQSLSGTTPYEYLLISPQISRRNDGRIRDADLKRYEHLESGGWWCSGLDPLNNWEPMLWGCFKPDQPRRTEDGKLIKYEHPPKTPTRAFFLQVPLYIWQRVSSLYHVPLPENFVVSEPGAPLCFWQWVQAHPEIPLILTEGAKKAGALLSAGFVAIALPGINSGYRHLKDEFGEPTGTRQLIPELSVLNLQGREVYFCFDHDPKHQTVKAVNHAIATTGQLLSQSGAIVKVISWSQPEKGVDDLISAHGVEALHAAYQSASVLEQWQAQSYSQLSYPPNVLLNQPYLGQLNIPPDAKLIAIKSPKGTGKTESLSEIAAEAIRNGQWVLVLSHRVQLGEELCRRFGIPYLSQVKDFGVGKLFGFGLCIDSLHPHSQARFCAKNWSDGLVILDEAEQVIWHMLNSSTCQTMRVQILSQLQQLITNVLNSPTGRVILSDADLSDVSVDYIPGLAGLHLKPWVLVNLWKPHKGWDVYHFRDKTPAGTVAALSQHIADGGKPFVCCSSQKLKGHYSTHNLEATFRKRFPHKKILRIDSETIANPKHPAFNCVTRLDQVLRKYDVVIASPSLETGVSIDITGHFTSVWGIFQGVQAENTVRQFLARPRAPINRYIWVANYGFNKIGNGSTSVKSLLASQQQLAKLNIHLLRQADVDLDIDGSFSPVSLLTWAKMACRINQGMLHYRESILNGLRAEGHRIIDTSSKGDISQMMKEALAQTRNEERLKDASAHIEAPDIEHKEYERLKESRTKTPEEHLKEHKHFLQMRYGVEVTPELVIKDSDGWHPQLQLHYYLTLGRDYLPARDKKRFSDAVEKGKGLGSDGKDAVWLPDFNKSQLGAAIALLYKVGIHKLFDPDREFRSSDPDLQVLAQILKADPWGTKVILGVTVNQKDSPIAIVQMVLAKLGLKLTRVRQDGTGKRERVYRFIPPEDGREQIFAAWLTRDVAAVQSVSEADAHPLQKTNQATHTPLPCTEEATHTPCSDTASATHTPGNNEYLDHQGCEDTLEYFPSHSEQQGEQPNATETPQAQARRFCDDLLYLTNSQQLQEALSHLSTAAQALISELLQLPEFWLSAERYSQLVNI